MSELTNLGKPNVLVVDDEKSMGEFLQIMLRKQGYTVRVAINAEKALEIISQDIFDLVITDLAMPGMDGLELLRRIKSASPDTAVIIMTAYGTPENAIAAMKSGAYDYITKPFNNEAISLTVLKCLQNTRLARENLLLKKQMQVEHRFGKMIGTSTAMKEVYELIQVVRNTKSNVLITGESGTGKELVAREIHFNGEMADRPFVTVNCGAIPDNLMESELFGHVRGAFTGAVSNRLGLFKAADTGTIFLDEIGELTQPLQVKLLRVLQNKIIRPIGSTEDITVDVRILAATNRNLEEMVRTGGFREDLYFRLNVIQIRVPPLRERKEDLPPLMRFFLKKLTTELGKDVRKISQEAMDVLMDYDYPGNIRELENILERSLALEKSPALLPESLPPHLRHEPAAPRSAARGIAWTEGGVDLEKHLDEIEKALMLEALKRASGVKTEAAKLLHLSFRSFRYRLEKHGLD